MIGLALEGGGVRGSYQAGAYIAFLECKIKIDGVVGTSIGALNGALIASHRGLELPSIWRSLNMSEVFGFSKSYIDAINQKVFNLNYLKQVFINALSIINNQGIELAGLKKLIDEEIDVNLLLKSSIDFGLITVRLKDFKPLCLFKKDMPKEKLKEYILASCFLPIFKREKLIDDHFYLDGGFYDVSPVNMLLKNGYQKVYLIKIHGLGIRQKYAQDADVTIIEPKRPLGSILDLDPKRIDENIKMGYYDALKVLKNLDGIHYVFKPLNERKYQKINRQVSHQEFKRLKNFFKTQNYKDTTIKALEYIMQKENINYYHIYSIKKIIKIIKKKYRKDHFIYNYVQKLKYYI